ncbi:hypothetical protein ANTPLA_LOCUS119 [Anthophora plagiata]
MHRVHRTICTPGCLDVASTTCFGHVSECRQQQTTTATTTTMIIQTVGPAFFARRHRAHRGLITRRVYTRGQRSQRKGLRGQRGRNGGERSERSEEGRTARSIKQVLTYPPSPCLDSHSRGPKSRSQSHGSSP